jgi:thioredoxin-related protein
MKKRVYGIPLAPALILSWPLLSATISPSVATELVAFETGTCPYCRVFNSSEAEHYKITAEGRRAHLRIVDINAPKPAELSSVTDIWGTPTFVLVDNGKEIGRILGFQGAESFYSSLDDLLKQLDARHRVKVSQRE